MGNRLKILGLLVSLAFSFTELRASDYKEIVNLKGNWSFTVGDNLDWAKPDTNLQGWDEIRVPSNWERYYNGYNGFAWYRKSFNVTVEPSSEELVLFLGFIDDIDEVFINGVKVGQSGKFPPDQVTAYNIERRYTFPKSLLKPSGNSIAVRVYDEGREGGIVRGEKIGVYYDATESMLLYDLSGNWKFTIRKYSNIQSPGFDDSSLGEIHVPAAWESQGYEGYDGYGWYRKHFTLPGQLPTRNLYLMLGQIDEIDKVYLNGRLIGQTRDLEQYNDVSVNDAFLLYRAYPIPEGLLKKENIITVEVLDKYGGGGIYSGPVGIMNKENRDRFMETHKVEKKRNWFQMILDFFDEN